MKKFTLMIAALLMTVFSANAEDKMTAEDVTIEPGGKGEIVISLDNDMLVYGWQTKFTLPEGITPVTNARGKVQATLSDRHDEDQTIVISDIGGFENTWGILCYHPDYYEVYGNSGVIVTVQIQADASFAGGEAKFFENSYSDENDVDHAMPDFTINISTPGGAVVKYAPAKEKTTFCSDKDLDFSAVTELTAYVASSFDKASGYVTLTKVENAPAGTGLYIVATTTGADIEIPVATSTDAVGTNLLKGVTDDVNIDATDGSNTNFVLSDGVFVPSAAGTVKAGRAYLQLPTADITAGAKIGVLFNETTGIRSVDGLRFTVDSTAPMYNLAGQKVNAQYKGVVIQNGKKVIRK